MPSLLFHTQSLPCVFAGSLPMPPEMRKLLTSAALRKSCAQTTPVAVEREVQSASALPPLVQAVDTEVPPETLRFGGGHGVAALPSIGSAALARADFTRKSLRFIRQHSRTSGDCALSRQT
jgi:hypothetical protein